MNVDLRPGNVECDHSWPNTSSSASDHDEHECCLGDRCWRKGIHECWCSATVEKDTRVQGPDIAADAPDRPQ